MGKRCYYDLDVQEAFGLFGLEVAVFFEALRFRQQLYEGALFPYRSQDMTKNTGLSYKQQIRARRVLEAAEWIETKRGKDTVSFRITDIAKHVIKYTPHRQNMQSLQQKRRNLVNKNL